MKDTDLLLSTPFTEYKDTIISGITSTIGLNKDLVIPTTNLLINSIPNLRVALEESFTSHGGVKDGKYGKVAYPIQLLQGALLDSLVVGYHKPSGKYAYYTASERHIQKLSPGFEFKTDKIYKLNTEGILHGLRVDFTYTSKEDFATKLTRLTVKTHLVADDFIFIPLESIYFLGEMIKDLLAKGKHLFISQTSAGVKKDRFITRSAKTLAKYSDSDAFARKVSSKSFVQLPNAVGYFPVIGATSNTTGLERVKFLMLDKLALVRDNSHLVEKSDFGGNIRLVVTSLLSNELYSNYSDDKISKYNEYISGIVDIITQKVFLDYLNDIDTPEDMPEDAIISLGAANLIIRDLSDEKLQSVWKMFLDRGMVARNPQKMVEFISTGYEEIGSDIPREELESLLKEKILKVVTTRKDGSFSTMYVTNNSNLLKEVYGEDYKRDFESVGVRIRDAKYRLEHSKERFDDIVASCGFDALVGKGTDSVKEDLSVLEEYVENVLNYKPRKSNSNENLVMARKVFGVVTPKGVEGYYCNIDVTKLYEVVGVY